VSRAAWPAIALGTAVACGGSPGDHARSAAGTQCLGVAAERPHAAHPPIQVIQSASAFGDPSAVAFGDGSELALASDDGIRIWDARARFLLRVVPTCKADYVALASRLHWHGAELRRCPSWSPEEAGEAYVDGRRCNTLPPLSSGQRIRTCTGDYGARAVLQILDAAGRVTDTRELPRTPATLAPFTRATPLDASSSVVVSLDGSRAGGVVEERFSVGTGKKSKIVSRFVAWTSALGAGAAPLSRLAPVSDDGPFADGEPTDIALTPDGSAAIVTFAGRTWASAKQDRARSVLYSLARPAEPPTVLVPWGDQSFTLNLSHPGRVAIVSTGFYFSNPKDDEMARVDEARLFLFDSARGQALRAPFAVHAMNGAPFDISEDGERAVVSGTLYNVGTGLPLGQLGVALDMRGPLSFDGPRRLEAAGATWDLSTGELVSEVAPESRTRPPPANCPAGDTAVWMPDPVMVEAFERGAGQYRCLHHPDAQVMAVDPPRDRVFAWLPYHFGGSLPCSTPAPQGDFDVAVVDLRTGERAPVEFHQGMLFGDERPTPSAERVGPPIPGLRPRLRPDGKPCGSGPFDEPPVFDGTFSADGRFVFADNFAWSLPSGKLAHTFDSSPAMRPRNPDGFRVQSLDGASFLIAYVGGRLDWWQPEGDRVVTLHLPTTPGAIIGGAAGRFYAGTSEGTLARIVEGKVESIGQSDGGPIGKLAVSPDGSMVVTTSADNATRVWDATTLEVRAALAHFWDGEWVAFTPDGAYEGTREVAERVGWAFAGPEEGFRFEQFARDYDRPDIVRARLAGQRAPLPSSVVGRPPSVAMVESPPGVVAGGLARLRVRARSEGRVDTLRVYVEGRPVVSRAVCGADVTEDLEVPLMAGMNRVTVSAFDDRGLASNPLSLDVKSTREDLPRPEVWVVAVGVNRYPNLPRSSWLEAADDDARAVGATFSAMSGGAYAGAHVTLLTDEQATPRRIADALDGLSRMKPNDVAVVFLAGHGLRSGAEGDMVFVTGGIALTEDGRGPTAESLRESAIGWRDINARLASAKGRVLVLLDACHSGSLTQDVIAPNDALANALATEGRAGAVVFAAAKGRQASLEPGNTRGLVLDATKVALVTPTGAPQERHGFFTGALLRSLRDRATDTDGDGAIQLGELIDAVTTRVTLVSGGAQTPWVAHRDLFGDFKVADAPRGGS
jgi:hypothetical protein